MAQESIRGCGYRKVGALYLVGSYKFVPCDRLPYPLDVCPICGGGIKVSRAFTKIDPLKLFGPHDTIIQSCSSLANENRDKCQDLHRPCSMCDPTEDVAFIMRVGEKHYPMPSDFVREGMEQGISKRIPWMPKELELGKTIIYLAHPRACEIEIPPAFQRAFAETEAEAIHMRLEKDARPLLLEAAKLIKRQGIFGTFVPQRVEKLIWEKDATEETLADLEKKGITPVIIKGGDLDHV